MNHARKRTSQSVGLLTAAVGITVLAGWQWEISVLKIFFPGSVVMKANTGMALLLAGLALWSLPSSLIFARWFARCSSVVVVMAGLLTLLEYIFGWNFGIDEMLFREPGILVATSHPGRMAPNTAFNFVLIGSALFLLTFQKFHGSFLADFPLVFSLSISAIAFIGYVTGLEELTGPPRYTQIAANTAATFVVLCLGLLAYSNWGRGFSLTVEQKLFAGLTGAAAIVLYITLLSVSGMLSLAETSSQAQQIQIQRSLLIIYASLVIQFVLLGMVFVIVKRDLTGRRKAEEALRTMNDQLESRVEERTESLTRSEERYRSTLDNMLEGCQIIGFDYTYLYLNDVACQQGRRNREELLGRTMMEMYPGIDETPFFRILRECMQQRIHRQIDNEFTYPDETKGWFKLSLEPVPEGVFILSVDITKEKQLTDELTKHREHLEELVVSRTEQLEAANKELEAFSYSVSHDLRAPLRHIHGFVELLGKKATSLDDQSRRFLNTISGSAKQMGDLIDDLLVFSRYGRSDMLEGRVNMNAIVKEAISNVNGEVGNRSVEWVVGDLPEVCGDASMLRVVMSNLVSNAIKYTRPRDQTRIQISAKSEDDKQLVFSVQDNGVGFDMKYSHKLFGVFERLHSASDFEGTGIGLATVRRVIQRHGGKTWAEGELNKGATIFFTLPKWKEPQKE